MHTSILVCALFAITSADLWEDFKGFTKDVGSTIEGIYDEAGSTVEGIYHEAGSTIEGIYHEAGSTIEGIYDEAEKFFREKILGEKKKMVEEHNKLYKDGKSSYKLEINDFRYVNFSEVKNKYSGLHKVVEGVDLSQAYKIPEKTGQLDANSTVDWRTRGLINRVRRQGKCGGCWAFAAAAAIETHYGRKTGELVSLSPQHLLDCAGEFHNEGCNGGYQEYAFGYIAKNGGIALEDDYKYTGKTNKCRYNPSKRSIQIKGFTTIPEKDEEKMKEILSNFGPLACSVALTDEFISYNGGIFDDPTCASLEPAHTVTVIGYGKDHWLIKNSWGHTWGENGYMRIALNNWCNIALECSYPIL